MSMADLARRSVARAIHESSERHDVGSVMKADFEPACRVDASVALYLTMDSLPALVTLDSSGTVSLEFAHPRNPWC